MGKAVKEGRVRGGAAVLSVWALLARSSFYKIMGVLFLAGLAELGLFYHCLCRTGGKVLFEAAVEESRVGLLFLGALGAVFFLLAGTEAFLDREGRYTLLRLKISQTGLFAVKAVYNVFCLLLLFAVQAGLVFGMAWLYGRQGWDTPQFLFLAFYRSEFLHCLLPMEEAGKWVRNILLLLAFGMEAAGGGSGRLQGGLFALAAVTFTVPIGMGWREAVGDIAYAAVIAANVREAVFREKLL